jgi:hypothetical protein
LLKLYHFEARLGSNSYALRLSALVQARFNPDEVGTTQKANGYLAELAYVFTPPGFRWLQSLMEARSSEGGLELGRQVVARTDRLRQEFLNLAAYLRMGAREWNSLLWDDYLLGTGPPLERHPLVWWSDRGATTISHRTMSDKILHIRCQPMCDFARFLLSLPATEACCERLVSILSALFPPRRMSASETLIQAQMLIKCEMIYRNGQR